MDADQADEVVDAEEDVGFQLTGDAVVYLATHSLANAPDDEGTR